MQELLVDPRVTAVNIVSLPEELPVNESVELAHAVERTLRMPPGKVFLNRAFLPRFEEAEKQELARPLRSPVLDAAANAALAHVAHAERTAIFRERLQREIAWPLAELPFLYPEGGFGR